MPHYYLAPYIGTGTDQDEFRPRGAEQPGWAAVDLRPDSTVPSGRALLMVPVRDDTIGHYLGDAPDETSDAVKSAIESGLGITLAGTRLRHILAEVLGVHGREDGTRWRPLRPMRDGAYRIYLQGLWWQARALAGGASISESFNTADSDTLGPDLAWTELVGDIDIVSNEARSVTLGSQVVARADSNLDTDDHQVLASVSASEETAFASVGLIARKSNAATLTFYLYRAEFQGNATGLSKCVSGTYTALGSDTSVTLTAGTPYALEGRINGSSLELLLDTVSKNTATDTAITGNLRTGLRGNKATSGYVKWDLFSASDITAASAGGAGAGPMYPRMQRTLHQSWTVPRAG